MTLSLHPHCHQKISQDCNIDTISLMRQIEVYCDCYDAAASRQFWVAQPLMLFMNNKAMKILLSLHCQPILALSTIIGVLTDNQRNNQPAVKSSGKVRLE